MSNQRCAALRTACLSGLALVAALACGKPQQSAPASPAPPAVHVLALQPRPVTVNTRYVGQLQAFNTVEIRPQTDGLLEKQVAVEGSRVKKGDVLFQIDRRPYVAALAAATAALTQARAAQARSGRDLERVQPLSEINAVSQQELDAVRTQQETQRAAVDSAQAQVKTARLNLEYTTITSPIDGTVGRVLIRMGGLLTAYQSLLTTIYATDPMYVNFSVSERQVLELQRRFGAVPKEYPQAALYKLVLGDGSEYPHAATLNFIDPAVDPATGTIGVRLAVQNAEQRLIAGQFVRVVVPDEQLPNALLVPQRAVLERQGQTSVFVVREGDTVEDRKVTMGARIGADWLVEEGLTPGERVVVDGVQKLRPGIRVKPQTDATSEAGVTAPAASAAGR
jgi:membrane fusion protein, multidrug efflux system